MTIAPLSRQARELLERLRDNGPARAFQICHEPSPDRAAHMLRRLNHRELIYALRYEGNSAVWALTETGLAALTTNASLYWTPEMDASLRSQWLRKVGIKTIAYNLGRSITAVKHRRGTLNLPPRKNPGSPREKRVNCYLDAKVYRAAALRAQDRQQSIPEYLHYLIQRDVG